MGQKANSTSLRLGIKKSWPSKYIEKTPEELSFLVFQDLQIRKYIDRFLKFHGLTMHTCTIHRSQYNLELFISYFTTLSAIKTIKTINNKRFDKKIPISSLLQYKIFTRKNNFKNKKFLSTKNFINKLLTSLGLFLKKKYTINILLQNLNKSLSTRLTNNESASFRKSMLHLRYYSKSFFFLESINILLISIRKRHSAKILSEFISSKLSLLKRHNYFLTFIRRTLLLLINSKYSFVQGLKLRISGRFNGAPRSKTRVFQINKIPLQTLESNINYHQSTSFTGNGTFGIKLWISEK